MTRVVLTVTNKDMFNFTGTLLNERTFDKGWTINGQLMSIPKWIETLAVGDSVGIKGSYFVWNSCTIKRLTKTQIVVVRKDGIEYRFKKIQV